MNFSFVLERKKRLRSLVFQAPAGLFPDSYPRRWIAYLFAFYSDPHPRRFRPTPHTPVASPLPPQAPPQERRGSDPRGLAPPGPAEGPQSSGPLLAGKQTSTDIPVYLILVGKGASRGVHRHSSPTPSSQRRESPDSGSSSGGLAGISTLDLGLIITPWLLLLFLPKGERQKNKTVGFI